MLLRRFYVQENDKGEFLVKFSGPGANRLAPVPHSKKGRVLKENIPALLSKESEATKPV